MNTRPFLKAIASWCRRHSTKILAGAAIAAEAAGFYFMHREAPVVRDRLNELPEDAKFIDKFKAAAPVYIPSAGMFLLSSGAIVGGCALGEHRVAMLTSLYTASETMLHKCEEKIVEKYGKEEAKAMKEEAVKEVLHNQASTGNEIIYTGNGLDVFFEGYSGRYFASSREAVDRGIAEFEKRLHSDIWCSLNQLYDCWDIPRTDLGGYFGWNADDIIDKPFDVGFSGSIAPNKHSCQEIHFYNEIKTYDGSTPTYIG